MSVAVTDLIGILDLEPLEVNLFRGRPPHSLHGYFMLPGDPKVPIIYDVDRIRDGRSFTTRRVVAIQHGHAIFTMAVSFHGDEPMSLTHQAKMPEVPQPEDLPSEEQIRKAILPSMPEA